MSHSSETVAAIRAVWTEGYERGREAKAGPAPLAYLIVRADVVADMTGDADSSACWTLQASHILDLADDTDQARYAAQAAVRRTGQAVCVLAVTVAETVEPTPAGPETL